MSDQLNIEDVEIHANFEAVARLNMDQYSALMIAMVEWDEANKDKDPDTAAVLRTIDITRTR